MQVKCECGTITDRPEQVCRDCYEQDIRRETRDMFPDTNFKAMSLDSKLKIYEGPRVMNDSE